MKRSPPPLRSAAFSTNSTASRIVELLLDPALHPLGERVARLLHARAGRRTPPASRSPSRSPVAMPRIARRVVCGLSDTIATGAPVSSVHERRLADVRAAGDGDEPRARHRRVAQLRHHAVLQRQHLAVVGLVVVARQVQHAVDGRLDQVLGVRRADHDVAELARAGGRAGAVDRERQHVGRRVDAAMLAVQLPDPLRRRRARRSGGRPRSPPPRSAASAAGRSVGRALELDHRSAGGFGPLVGRGAQPARARSRRGRSTRSRSAAPACAAPRRRRRSSRTRCP